MRTTIQIAEDQRDKLLELAAQRGHKGCAKIVQEAVAQYLQQQERGPAVLPADLVTIEDRTMTAPSAVLPETRADKLWTVIGWIYEEAAGLVGLARAWGGRVRRSHATDVN